MLVNYVNCFKDICYQIDVASISRANRLINSTKPDDSYTSDVYKTIRDFVKAAVTYYLHIYPQYSMVNLHHFEPNLRDDSIDLKQREELSNTKVQSFNARKISKSPIKASATPVKVSKSPIARSKTPTNPTPKKVGNQVFVFQSPKASLPKTPTTKPTTQFFPKSGSKSPAAVSRAYQTRLHNLETAVKASPKAKSSKNFNLNKSFDEIKARIGGAENKNKKLPQQNLQRKIEKTFDEKSHRSASVTPKTTHDKPELLPEDKSFFEDLAIRLQLEEESHFHKKATKQFKQKITKLLIDENKRVIIKHHDSMIKRSI